MSDKKAKQLKYAANQFLKDEREVRTDAEAVGISVVDGVVVMPKDKQADASADAAPPVHAGLASPAGV